MSFRGPFWSEESAKFIGVTVKLSSCAFVFFVARRLRKMRPRRSATPAIHP